MHPQGEDSIDTVRSGGSGLKTTEKSAPAGLGRRGLTLFLRKVFGKMWILRSDQRTPAGNTRRTKDEVWLRKASRPRERAVTAGSLFFQLSHSPWSHHGPSHDTRLPWGLPPLMLEGLERDCHLQAPGLAHWTRPQASSGAPHAPLG